MKKLVKESLYEWWADITTMGTYREPIENRRIHIKPKSLIIKGLKENGFFDDIKKLENLVKNGPAEFFTGNIVDGMEHVVNYPQNWRNVKTVRWQKKLMADAQALLDEIWETQQRKQKIK